MTRDCGGARRIVEQMQAWVAGWLREQEDLRHDVVKRVREQRGCVRELSGRGHLPVFEVGDYVLVAWVRKLGRVLKPVQTWTGSWRVVPEELEHVCVMGDIVTGKTKEVHVVRMRPYAGSSLVVGAEVREVFEMTKHQGEFEIADVSGLARIRREWENTGCRSRRLVFRVRSQRGNRCQLSTPTLPNT